MKLLFLYTVGFTVSESKWKAEKTIRITMAENPEARKEPVNRKPPIETASWCYRDKEDDVHHDFAWTITNFSRKINVVPNSKLNNLYT